MDAIPEPGRSALLAAAIFVAALVLGRMLGGVVAGLVRRMAGPPWEPIARRATIWLMAGLGAAVALETLGVDLSVLLGAAGFLSVAVGFASQTTASNFISGMFLMLENSVKVGDAIEVGGVTGEVLSIDPLSVRLRTYDNRMVRVPNETLVKTSLTNLSGFPIRRIDIPLQLAQEADLRAAREALLALADLEAEVLQEPAPVVHVLGFDRGLALLQFNVWASRDNWIRVRTEVGQRIPEVLAEAGAPLCAPRMWVDQTRGSVGAAAQPENHDGPPDGRP
jgi:small-conductance mechanosensitive channel